MMSKLDVVIPGATSTPMLMALAYVLAACVVILYVTYRALGKRGKTVPRRVLIGLPLLAVLGVLIAYSIMIVDIGTVQVVRIFGKVLGATLRSRRAHHLAVSHGMTTCGSAGRSSSCRRSMRTRSLPRARPQPEAQRALALSADRIALSSDITFPYLINPDIAWKVFSDISPAYEA